MKQTYKLLIIGIITIFSSVSIFAQVSFNNSSFEGPTGTNVIPSPWSICGSSTVDTCPGPFEVNLAASEGNTYIGLWSGAPAPLTAPAESFSQIIPCAVKTGKQYTFSLDIAWDLDGAATYTQGGTVQIWGGMANCAKTQLLWQGAPTTPQVWQTKTVNFTPTSDWTYFTISALQENDKYVLLDNLTPISRAGATVSTINASCGGLGNDGSATVNAPADGTPWQYSWSPGGQTTPTISGLSQGIYTCTISDPSEICPIPIVIKAVIQGPPVITATATNTFICPGENSQLETTVPTSTIPNCTYTVNMYDSFGDGWGTPSNLKVYKNTVLIGTYTCTGSAANSNSFTVAQGDALEFSYTSATSYNNEQRFEVRDASSAILYNSGTNPTTGVKYTTVANCGVTPGTYSYSWTPTTGLSNPAIANPVATPTATTTYSVSVTSSDNPGCASTKDVTITVGGATSIATTIVDANCGTADGSFTITGVTAGTAPYSYNFNNLGYSGVTVYNGLTQGIYTLDVKDADGCVYKSTVTVNNIGAPTNISYTTANTVCGNSNGLVNLNTVTGGISPYQYDFDGLGYSSTTNYTGLLAKNYRLNIKDANGCIYSTYISITDAPGPSAALSTITNTTCGLNNGSITIDSVTSGTAPYQFELEFGGYGTTNNFSGLAAGSYTINIKDANGCVYTTINTVNAIPEPTAIATTITNQTCGANGSVILGAVTGGTTPYTYNFNNLGFSATTSFSGIAAGTYSIIVKDANGCVYTTAATIIDNTTTVNISYTGSPYSSTLTTPQGVTISGTGGYTGGTFSAAPAGLSIDTSTGTIIPNTSIPGTYNVTYTAPASGGCPTTTAIATVVISNSSTDGIDLIAYFDSNNNGIQDSGESNFNQGQFQIELNSSGTIHNIVSSTGQYTIYESNPSNSYNINYITNDPNYIVNPSSYNNITVATGSGITSYSFPVALNPHSDLRVSIYPSSGPVPGNSYWNYIYIENVGNQTIPAGTLTYTKDSHLTITNISPTATLNAGGFTYDYPSLAPFQSEYIFVTLQVPTIPTVNLGDFITNTASVSIPAGDIEATNNSASLTQIVKGAYDPNDKNESHGPQIVHSTFTSNDYLSYTIQFENTGTANAISVKVNDVLDAKLDETSVKMINASHNYILDRVGNDLTWSFNGINLPPSVAGTSTGKGYINFQIKPKAGYAVGDIINNTANIYFDFNPAILTNTFSTEFVTTLGVAGFVNSQFLAYPNPTTGLITIALKNNAGSIDAITVTDVLGKTIMTNSVHSANTTVDISHLTKGLYFVKIQTEGQVKTLKVVKE